MNAVTTLAPETVALLFGAFASFFGLAVWVIRHTITVASKNTDTLIATLVKAVDGFRAVEEKQSEAHLSTLENQTRLLECQERILSLLEKTG